MGVCYLRGEMLRTPTPNLQQIEIGFWRPDNCELMIWHVRRERVLENPQW